MSTALAPSHLAHLKKSGLTPDVIEQNGYYSVPPRDLGKMSDKLKRYAESGMALPYHDLDGKRLDFQRVRVFPPIANGDGHAMKYFQPAGTPNHLYLPQGRDWRAVMHDAAVPLAITEGELKAAAVNAGVMPCLGIAGCWNFRTKLDTGEALHVPELDLFTWTGRPVLLVPDSDLWRPEKCMALAGFYALGMLLHAKGARVTFLVLPELCLPEKTGADDFLVKQIAFAKEAWEGLSTRTLTDEVLLPLAKWHQDWTARHTQQEALRQRAADDPDVDSAGGVYTVKFQKYHVSLILDRLTDARGGVTAELAVYVETVEVLSGTDLSLKSETSREKIYKSLKDTAEGIPWKVLIQKACAAVLKRHREGEPLLVLSTARPVEPVHFLVNPFLYQRKISVIFGDGGLGKSTFGLLLAMLCATGETVAGIAAVGKTKPLYLDFEDDSDIHTLRVHALATAHPELQDAQVLYKRCTEALPLMVPELLRQIAAEGIGAVFVDSLAMAAGGIHKAQRVRLRSFARSGSSILRRWCSRTRRKITRTKKRRLSSARCGNSSRSKK